jgi:acetyltransferase-like isoleucine patch superfamily enzyme
MYSFGYKSRIIKPMLISNYKYISVGDNVIIRNGVRLEVVDPQNEVVIKIGNNVNIEQYVHIVARCNVSIGDNVSITGGCSIVDGVHINPGVTIGRNCIVGARSVVTKNIDEYSVVAGNPAKVIKKYNFDKHIWEKV